MVRNIRDATELAWLANASRGNTTPGTVISELRWLARQDERQRLEDITVPTLVIGATHDTMDPKYMEWMSRQFPKGNFLLCPNGSHMCMWDDQENYFKILIPFLTA